MICSLTTGDRGQQRPNHPRFIWFIICLATNLRFRATRWFHGSTRGTGLGFRTCDHGTTRTRARRAFTNLARLIAGADARRAGRYSRLQNITRHVGRSRAFCLEHITAHIGLGRARRYTGFQNILGPVYLRTLDAFAIFILAAVLLSTFTAALASRPTARTARALCYINKGLSGSRAANNIAY